MEFVIDAGQHRAALLKKHRCFFKAQFLNFSLRDPSHTVVLAARYSPVVWSIFQCPTMKFRSVQPRGFCWIRCHILQQNNHHPGCSSVQSLRKPTRLKLSELWSAVLLFRSEKGIVFTHLLKTFPGFYAENAEDGSAVREFLMNYFLDDFWIDREL